MMQVPVSFVYGETDWMDPKAGVRVAASVRQSRGALSPTDCQVGAPLARLPLMPCIWRGS